MCVCACVRERERCTSNADEDEGQDGAQGVELDAADAHGDPIAALGRACVCVCVCDQMIR